MPSVKSPTAYPATSIKTSRDYGNGSKNLFPCPSHCQSENLSFVPTTPSPEQPDRKSAPPTASRLIQFSANPAPKAVPLEVKNWGRSSINHSICLTSTQKVHLHFCRYTRFRKNWYTRART